ncbi:MAG TPA: NfeD family protein [Thermoleophilaceae bacterium]|nr:NfeD family protein [Thermoleophilaceae bacterium]
MEEWVVWMAAAGVLAVGEILTTGFFLAPVAIAAVMAAAAALLGAGVALQMVVFIVATTASIGFLRPVARGHMHTPARLRTGTAALVGQPATVLERVDGQGGSVKLAGEVWTARAFDEDQVFEPGQRVDVLKIDGATALVHE